MKIPQLLSIIATVFVIITGSIGIIAYQLTRNTLDKQLSKATSPTPIATGTFTRNANEDPYPPHNQKLMVYDPLNKSDHWSKSSFSGGYDCNFAQGSFSIAIPPYSNLFCPESTGDELENFTFEVHLKIMKGDCGGLAFRIYGAGKAYEFLICTQGYYVLSATSPPATYKTIAQDYTPTIGTTLGQTNIVGVVVEGSTIAIYINYKKNGNVSRYLF